MISTTRRFRVAAFHFLVTAALGSGHRSAYAAKSTGPQDFARYFGFDGTGDMAKLDAYFNKRVKLDSEFEKAVNGLTKAAFRKYYALRASAPLPTREE